MTRKWTEEYRRRLMKRGRALSRIKRGQRVFLGSGCGEPIHLVEGLMERADELHDVKLLHFLTLSRATSPEKRFDRRFRHNTFFVGPITREAINQARADYTPVFLSELPGLFRQRIIPVDVALVQVSEPDRWGYVSLGVSVDITKSAMECADLVIAQVNPLMPRTAGDTLAHITEIDCLVEYHEQLLEYEYPDSDDSVRSIAANAAKLVNDGDTVHIGYGQIPYAVLEFLERREHLGVHTEVVGDKLIPLIESGAVTGQMKTLDPGKVVASFCIGTRKIYDFVDQNQMFKFMPADYVYNPSIICRNDNMISIGAALEVDLSGQVCSDSKGYFFYSGIGGRLDFLRGAAMSKGGRSVICLPATTRDGQQSRIVYRLAEGAGVAATRGDIDYVATEFGVVALKGKSIRERAMALISIAHPKFRAELLERAKARGYVYPDQIIVESDRDRYPHWAEAEERLASGRKVLIRPIKPTDETALQDYFYSHSEETIYKRYFRPVRALPHDTAQTMVNVDYVNTMALVATTGQIGREKIVGVARYVYDKNEDRAEVAYTVRESLQGQGLGALLQRHLTRYARRMGFKGLSAVAFETNQAFLNLFARLGPIQRERIEAGVFKLWIDFDQLSPEAEAATSPEIETDAREEKARLADQQPGPV